MTVLALVAANTKAFLATLRFMARGVGARCLAVALALFGVAGANAAAVSTTIPVIGTLVWDDATGAFTALETPTLTASILLIVVAWIVIRAILAALMIIKAKAAGR